jgi:hypothetical protein
VFDEVLSYAPPIWVVDKDTKKKAYAVKKARGLEKKVKNL